MDKTPRLDLTPADLQASGPSPPVGEDAVRSDGVFSKPPRLDKNPLRYRECLAKPPRLEKTRLDQDASRRRVFSKPRFDQHPADRRMMIKSEISGRLIRVV